MNFQSGNVINQWHALLHHRRKIWIFGSRLESCFQHGRPKSVATKGDFRIKPTNITKSIYFIEICTAIIHVWKYKI